MCLVVFLSFHGSVHCGLCSAANWSAECVGESWPGFFSLHFGDKQWKGIPWPVASLSKTRVLMPAYKQQACCAVRSYYSRYWRYDSRYWRSQNRFSPTLRKQHPSDWVVACFLKRSSIMYTCIYVYTCTWVALSNFCVTRVNMRNIFNCTITEYAHCPQQVQLLLTHSVLVVWAADATGQLIQWSW
jgi:hypothetical protein